MRRWPPPTISVTSRFSGGLGPISLEALTSGCVAKPQAEAVSAAIELAAANRNSPRFAGASGTDLARTGTALSGEVLSRRLEQPSEHSRRPTSRLLRRSSVREECR